MLHSNSASKAVPHAGANEARLGLRWLVEQKVQNPAWDGIGCCVPRSYFRCMTSITRHTRLLALFFVLFNIIIITLDFEKWPISSVFFFTDFMHSQNNYKKLNEGLFLLKTFLDQSIVKLQVHKRLI